VRTGEIQHQNACENGSAAAATRGPYSTNAYHETVAAVREQDLEYCRHGALAAHYATIVALVEKYGFYSQYADSVSCFSVVCYRNHSTYWPDLRIGSGTDLPAR